MDEAVLAARAAAVLSPKRMAHTEGCVQTVRILAEKTGVDPHTAACAAYLHDITREVSLAEQLKICEKYGIIPDTMERESTALLHSLTGAAVAGREYGAPPEIVRAIRLHTTGDAEMTALDRILCLADAIEPTRAYPGVDALRKTAQTDPDRALLDTLTGTVVHLRAKGQPVHPRTLRAAAELARELSGREGACV